MNFNFSQNLLFSLTVFSCSADSAQFHEDLLNIARTTLSSKILSQHKEYFSKLAVDAVLRLKGSGNLSAIQIIKKTGGTLEDSFLDEGMNKEELDFFFFTTVACIMIFMCCYSHAIETGKLTNLSLFYALKVRNISCVLFQKFVIWRDTSVGNSCSLK